MPLPDLELALVAALVDPAAAGGVLEHLRPAAGREPAQQLAVYRGSVLGSMTGALRETFPVCARLVGERFFDAMAQRYVRQQASVSPDLGDYGAGLPEFIAGFGPAASVPYLPDVARFEWAWRRVLHGPDGGRLDLEALAAVPPASQNDLIFELPAASALLDSDYPVHRIWAAHQPRRQEVPVIRLDEGGARLLLWRRGLEVQIETLRPEEGLLLRQLQLGRRLEEVIDALAEQGLADRVPELLPRLVTNGWIAGFRLS